MKRFLVLTKAMFLIHLRNRAALFWNLAFPIFCLVIYSQVFGQNTVGETDYMSWAVPGMMVYNMLSFGLLSSGTIMIQMREKGILQRLQASPMPAGQLIGSYLLVNLAIGGLQGALILGFSVLAFQMPLTATGVLRALPMMLIGIVTFVALGQVVSGVSPTMGTAMIIGQLFNFGQMFITDLVMPIEMMPDGIQKIAPYLPGYAVAQLVRPPLAGGTYSPELWPNLLVTGLYAVVSGVAAAKLFRWAPRS
jgi:ABC-2 type transport system permease protein